MIPDIPDEVYKAFAAVSPKIDYSINPETKLFNHSFASQFPEVEKHIRFNMFKEKEHWEILFDYHNKFADKKYGLGCLPCYTKVYLFIRSRIMQRG